MSTITRRNSLGIIGAATAAGWLSANADDSPKAPHKWPQVEPRDAIRERYFPNVILTTHEGKSVRLYDDLIKDKVVVMNFMYTSCGNICPLVTENLVKVQKILGPRMGHDVFFCSFTLDPAHDTPQVLKDYSRLHRTGPGWAYLTGSASLMEMLRRRLGFTDPDPEKDKDKENHIGNIRYGNEPRLLWGACPGMSHVEVIVEAISWVDWPKKSDTAG
jgi:protein SCO1